MTNVHYINGNVASLALPFHTEVLFFVTCTTVLYK